MSPLLLIPLRGCGALPLRDSMLRMGDSLALQAMRRSSAGGDRRSALKQMRGRGLAGDSKGREGTSDTLYLAQRGQLYTVQ